MLRKQNLVITFASGHEFLSLDTFWAYIGSLKNISNADFVMLTHDMPDVFRDKLKKLDIIIVDVPKEQVSYIYRDRHLAFWNYLNDHGHKYKHVVVTDCKDVVFQTNPFDWVEDWKKRHDGIKGNLDFLNHFVILASEGFKVEKSGFACVEHFEFERDIPMEFLKKSKDRWVVNGGTAIGTPQALQNFHFLVWMTTLKTIGRCTDQASINWLMNYLDQDATYSISHPQHDNFCMTGEGLKEGSVEPILKDGVLYNPLMKPYCLLHQWERIDHLREEVLSQYLNPSLFN